MTDEWVLPLVVRIERDAPPTRTDALEAAAVAVLTMLTDGRAGLGRGGPRRGTAAASARSSGGRAAPSGGVRRHCPG